MKSKVPQQYIVTKSDEAAIEAGMFWNEDQAEHIRQFAKTFLKASKGRWGNKPVEFLDWQYEECVRPLFSWKKLSVFDKKTIKRFNKASIWIPKKNGKSFLNSCLALYFLCCSEEIGENIGIYASTKDQAEIVWGESRNFVHNNVHLDKRLKCLKSKGEILDIKRKSRIVCCSSDEDAAHGPDYSNVFLDELHVISKNLYDALVYSTIARDDPLICSISTAGNDRTTFAYENYLYCKNLLRKENPIVDTTIFPLIYELDPDNADKWDQKEQWYSCNPSLGTGLLKEESFEESVNEVKNNPSRLPNFLQLRLNVWSMPDGAWISPDHWNQGKQQYDFEQFCEMAKDFDVQVGMDLSKSRDNSAIVYMFEKNEEFWCYPRFFCPAKRAAQKQRREGFDYLEESRLGNIILTPGDEIEYPEIRRQIVADCQKLNIRTIGYDNWAAVQLIQWLRLEDGLNCEPIMPTPQGISRATILIENLIVGGKWHHPDHKLLNHNFYNAIVRYDVNQNPIPNKRDSTVTIDGVSASVYALSRWVLDNQYSPLIVLA